MPSMNARFYESTFKKFAKQHLCQERGEIVVAHVSLRKTFLARPQFFDVLFFSRGGSHGTADEMMLCRHKRIQSRILNCRAFL